MTCERKWPMPTIEHIPEERTPVQSMPIVQIPEELMRQRRTMPELDVPDDYEPPPSAAPTVTPNPNEDPHRGLKKVIRILESCRGLASEMIGDKSLQSSDPRVTILLKLAEAQGQVEGYMLGEQWKEKFGL